MPALEPRNELAWKAFRFCQSQLVVAGMGSLLGIQFPAIDRALEHFGLRNRRAREYRRVFDQVRVLGELWAEIQSARTIKLMPVEQRPKAVPKEPPPLFKPGERLRLDIESVFGENGGSTASV